MGSERTNGLLKWNCYRNRNLILQLITSNIWIERNYCISALPQHRWVPGIMHIRKWNTCKSLKRRSWPKLHFKAFKVQERSWWEVGKKTVQLLKNGKCLFYIQKVNCILQEEKQGCVGVFLRQAALCIHDFKNFSRNRIILLVKFWLLIKICPSNWQIFSFPILNCKWIQTVFQPAYARGSVVDQQIFGHGLGMSYY